MELWEVVDRPGYFGKHRNERHSEYSRRYGEGNWRIVWKIGKTYVDLLGACTLYEDAYFVFLQKRQDVLVQLIDEASDVYDDAPSNVKSGFDYNKQETERTHIQDIAIRRSLIRMGLWFRGRQLMQIRHSQGTHPLSMSLSPGKVPFHKYELIIQPELGGWWDPATVESFYQSNKFLQAKRFTA